MEWDANSSRTLQHTAEPCPRVVEDYRSFPELAVSVASEEIFSENLAGFQSTSKVVCRVPETLSLGTWQVGILNYDAPFALAQNFVPFQVLQKAVVGSVSPNVTALGSNTPLVLSGGPLGHLLRETADARCVFQASDLSGEATSAPWVLDRHRVACFPPAIPGLPTGRQVQITLRIHGHLLPSEASFLLYPQRSLYAMPVEGRGSSSIKLSVSLYGSESRQPSTPVQLLAQNTEFQGPAQVKLWTSFTTQPGNNTDLGLLEIPVTELGLLLSAPVVDYSVTFPPGLMLSAYFIDPTEAAPVEKGLLVRGTNSFEVAPSMLLRVPKIKAVYPRMVPWIDRSRRVINQDEDPSLLALGLGFVNTNRLCCQLVDEMNRAWASPYVIFISATQAGSFNIDYGKTVLSFWNVRGIVVWTLMLMLP
ncbi:unnamed protein product [Effrenium voratum]|nr:unnamed protein product [Effrenium voratum]